MITELIALIAIAVLLFAALTYFIITMGFDHLDRKD